MATTFRLSRKLASYSRRFFTSARYVGDRRANFDGRKFSNEVATRSWSGHVLKWLLSRKPSAWPAWLEAERGPTPPESVPGAQLRVTFINHSTVLIQTAGMNLLTDPVWSTRVGPFPWLGAARVRDPGLAFEQIPRIDAILLSHDHYDHMDVRTLRMLLERDRPRLLCGLGVDRSLAIEGLAGAEAFDWWESCVLSPDLRAVFTPSRHFSGRGLYDQNSTLWGSFVVLGPAGPVYFGGDTGYGPHFREIQRRFGPMTCALLPIGCYEPRWFMESFHMSPGDAVQAHIDLAADFSLGIHYGTFQLGDESYEKPAEELTAELVRHGVPAGSFQVPRFGTGISVLTRAVLSRRVD